jgi:hypothetical protein
MGFWVPIAESSLQTGKAPKEKEWSRLDRAAEKQKIGDTTPQNHLD